MEYEQRTKRKVHFRDLSGGLKTIVVISWIMFGIYVLSFLVGFITGLAGA